MASTKRKVDQILAENLNALMGSGKKRLPQSFLATKGVTQSAIGEILEMKRSPRVRVLDIIADYFDMHPWQLLVMDLKPTERPLLRTARGTEAEFYRNIRKLAQEMGINEDDEGK
jgi:transcriptional regulator with XRE-family HTH domain